MKHPLWWELLFPLQWETGSNVYRSIRIGSISSLSPDSTPIIFTNSSLLVPFYHPLYLCLYLLIFNTSTAPTHCKDPDAGKDWGQEEQGTIEDEMVEWHHWLNGHEFERTQEDSEGQEAWSAAVHGVAKSGTQLSDWTTTRKGTRIMGWIISSFNRVMRMGTWVSELWNITQKGRPNDIELFKLWRQAEIIP